MTDPIQDSENTENLPPDDLSADFQLELNPFSEADAAPEKYAAVAEYTSSTESALETELTSPESSPSDGFVIGNDSNAFRMHRIPKNEPSFLRKVLPPILGGLAAFPIATAIMWYGLGKDIGSTGQYVSKYVPWIVPSKLRGGAFSSDGKFGGGKASVAKALPNKPSREAITPEPKPEAEPKPAPAETPEPANAPPSNHALPKPERSNSVEKVEKKESARPSIRTTLQQIAELQEDWNNTPKDREKQLEKLSSFYSACVQLSSLTGELRGNAIRPWQNDLDQFSASVLSSPTFSKAIELCSQGKVPNIPAPSLGDSVILIETLTIDNETAGNQEFPSKLTADDKPLPLIIPESLIKRMKNPSEPRKRILLGRMVDAESNSVILIHCCLE